LRGASLERGRGRRAAVRARRGRERSLLTRAPQATPGDATQGQVVVDILPSAGPGIQDNGRDSRRLPLGVLAHSQGGSGSRRGVRNAAAAGNRRGRGGRNRPG